MCARLPRFAAALAAVLVLSSCGDERTGTAFCAQLGRETPAIGAPITTKSEATAMVERYERLLGVSPLSIEKDMQTLVDLLRLAASVDTTDAAEMQELADASYAANQAALNVRDWAKSTCAVDISTGLQIDPPRTVPPTTVPPDTVPNESVPAASVPAETVPTESVPVSTP
jgi:hypothetical protein